MASLKDRVSLIPASEFAGMERAAAAEIEGLRAEYRRTCRDNIDRLQQLIREPEVSNPSWHNEAYRIAHDIKGQGSTFDQELVSIVAAALCKLIGAQQKNMTDDFVKRASAHCEAIKVVLETDIRGTGGDHGAALLKILAIAP